MHHIQCTVASSIGYYDIVLLAYTQDLTAVYQLQEMLRAVKKNARPIIANCHMLHGFYRNSSYLKLALNLNNMQSNTMKSKLLNLQYVMIRFNLQPEMPFEEFRQALQQEFENFPWYQDIKKFYVKQTKNDFPLYQTHGRSDCLVLAELPIIYLLSLFQKAQIFHPQSDFYKQYISSLRTSIRFLKTGEELTKVANQADNSNLESEIQISIIENEITDIEKKETNANDSTKESPWNLVDFTLGYVSNFVKTNKLHLRDARLLMRTLRISRNLLSTPYSHDVQMIIFPMIYSLCRVALSWIQYIENLIEQLPEKVDGSNRDLQKQNDLLNKKHQIAQEIEALFKLFSDYRDMVGQYIIDLMRSDRFFMEGITLSHSSIGSATKLLFAYNEMLYQLNRLMDCSTEKTKYTYSFLVTSGGCDITISNNLTEPINLARKMEIQFDYKKLKYKSYNPKNSEYISWQNNWMDINRVEDRILVIQLSERSIFDVSGTMFRTFHEGMHFCGDRLRVSRMENMRKSFAFLLASRLADVLLVPNVGNVQLLSDKEQKIQETLRKAQTNQFAEELGKELLVELEKIQILSEDPKDQVWDLYANTLIKNMTSQYIHYFRPSPTGLTPSMQLLYRLQLTHINQLAQKLKEESTKIRKIPPYPSLMIETNKKFLKRLEELKKLSQDNEFINLQQDERYFDWQLFWNLYWVQRIITEPELELPKQHMSIDQLKDSEEIKNYLHQNSIAKMLQDIYDGYAESFCDCMACTVLDMKLEDYLIAFLYENWDVEQSLPLRNLESILRIGATIHTCYSNNQSLTDEQTQAICVRCNYWNDNGWLPKDSLNAETLINHINSILQNYESLKSISKNITSPLEEYLSECIRKFRENLLMPIEGTRETRQEILDNLQMTYQKVRDLSNAQKTADGIVAVLKYWEKMKGGNIN